MQPTTEAFKQNAKGALVNQRLQKALGGMTQISMERRQGVVEGLPEFDQLRDQARDIKNHTLANLDFYLERFEENVRGHGGEVHWCRTPAEARQAILEICLVNRAQTVTKGKSMISEEIALNDFLADNNITPVETDLGEYIIQLRQEPPSHIIGPALHLTKEDVAETFREHHTELDPERQLDEASTMVAEARSMLRQRYLDADVGITGANFLVAETGSSIIVTNEGNGDLTQLLPKVHIVLASIEKIVPTLEDATTIERILARSATGQEFSAYTTMSTGPKRPDDPDGPEQYHVILLDNGRSALLGTEFQDVLRCIRCGACMNHCPVYQSVGGHAYGWVYGGPIGAVLTPALIGIEKGANLPNASSFCGRCEEVCPMRIPLPKMMRHWREEEHRKGVSPKGARWATSLWAFFARRPAAYQMWSAFAVGWLGWFGGTHGRFASLPLAEGWTRHRDMPAPEGKTFQQLWRERQIKRGRS